ncbi:Coq4 family protein [Synechococcus sp. C9]|uniref:Coq4 family protein n=1 Tax=Synechococcus sp. C9 TaxID=102119 RepID=UPI001FF63107|nr:Coq4 family protein [Synechococcus sp. C9]
MAWVNLEQQLGYISALKGVVSLLEDPAHTQSVYDIEDGLRDTQATRLSVEFVQSLPGVAELIRDRYLPPKVDVEALQKLPVGSLGRTYADYIISSGFDPNFYRLIPVKDDTNYVLLRMRQTHDIWHIVTGFHTDVPGELGLKAFELAQTRRTMAVILITGGLISTLFKAPQDLETLLEHLARGYRLGRQAKPLLAERWEDHWEKPLADWRVELGLEQAANVP